MIKNSLFILIFLSMGLVRAETEPKHPIDIIIEQDLENDPSTAGQIRAAENAVKRWDKLLNINYDGLMKQLTKEGQLALQKSQRAWIEWGNAERESLGRIYGQQDGTMWRAAGAFAMMELPRKRALRLGFLRNLSKEGSLQIEVLDHQLEIAPSSGRDDLRFLFGLIAPSIEPSVDQPGTLQYDLQLTPDGAPAGFVFYFSKGGEIESFIMDAYMESQLPTVSKLIQELRAKAGIPNKNADGDKVWEYAGWEFTHIDGGEGEDSTFYMKGSKINQ